MSGSNIYNLLANPAAANPDFYTKGLQNLNAFKDTQAKQAIAGITQQSIDPVTGQVDPAKFNLLISQSPQAAWAAGPAMQQQGQAQAAQGQGAQEALAAHRARLDSALGQMNGLLAKGTRISMDDVLGAANQAHFSPSEITQLSQDINSASKGDPNYDFTGWTKNHQTSNLAAKDQIEQRTPKFQMLNIGNQSVPWDTNGFTNPDPVNRTIGMTPEASNELVQTPTGPGGALEYRYTRGQIAAGLGSKTPGLVTGQGGGGTNAAGDSATRKAAEGGPPAAGTPAAAVAQRTHDFWISQGYSEAQVAGIMAGGPGSESDFTPTVKGDGGTSYGLYQHHGERLANMQKYFGLSGSQMPTEAQQNQYAAYEISPQGPLAKVGVALKAAQTPAEAATIWTRDFGVPADKSEIARRAAGAGRFLGPYAQAQGPQGASGAGPPGVQMGGAPPPPPGGAAGPYTGGGIGTALNPVVVRGTPIPAGKLLSGDVAAMQAGRQIAQGNPLAGGAMSAGPGAPTGNALAGPSVELPPQPGWGTAVGTYAGGPGPATAAVPVRPPVAAPVAAPVQQPARTEAAAPSGLPSGPVPAALPLGTGERVKTDIDAYTKDAGAVATHQGAVNTLQNAYRALQLADTGPGTQNLQAARAFLQSFGITTSASGDQATQWAEAHKYLMDYARTQGLLGGTDLQAQLAQGSNASTDIPKPAALAVVRNNIAKERMAMAQVQEAPGSAGYVDHTKNFAPAQDIRAYQADIMPPAELKEIEALKTSNPAAFKKFQASLDIARAHGLISDADLAAQNQRIRAMGR